MAQQQQPGAPIFGVASTAAMQIDLAGEGSSRSAAAFGTPAAHGTQASGPQTQPSQFGGLRSSSNWALSGAPRVVPVSDRGAGGWLEARLRALAQ